MDFIALFEAIAAVFMSAQSRRHEVQAERDWVGDE
jgi:hypothetical protein